MGSFDLRVRNSTRRSKERWVQLDSTEMIGLPGIEELRALQRKHDTEEIREFIGDEISNLFQRVKVTLAIHGKMTPELRKQMVKKLHMLLFDQTFWYKGPVRIRIETLIERCGDDEELFLYEYNRALQERFPVEAWSKCFVWNAKIVYKTLRSGKVRRTLRHHMKYRPSNPAPETVTQ